MSSLRSWLRAIADGFGSLTLDPSPQLARYRAQMEREIAEQRQERERRYGEILGYPWPPLPPLPPEAYTEAGALMEPREWPP